MTDTLVENLTTILVDKLQESSSNEIELKERLTELELALENWEWRRLEAQSQQEFSRPGLRTIARQARIFYLKNPLVRRATRLPAYYVFGRGLNINAKDETINEVVQAFLDDKDNLAELTGAIARKQKDIDLRLDGNLYLVLFTEPTTGHVRIGTIPADEIDQIIANPQNRKKVWFYKRIWTYSDFDVASGTTLEKTAIRYYYDFRYSEGKDVLRIGGVDVDRNPVYHIKVGGFSDWLFGVSEVYAILDWARAYKDFLSNFATIMQALARFAWEKKVKGGAPGVAAAKAKLGTTFAANQDASGIETNPPPTTASTFIYDENDAPVNPIRTANATTPADAAKPLRHMVASGSDLPDPMLSGDPQQGTLATAKSLDRPTELAFLDRQELWKEIYNTLLEYVLHAAVVAPNGALRALALPVENEYGETVLQWDENIDTHIDIDFPPILERDVLQAIQALVTASTFDGKTPSVIPDIKWLCKAALTLLGYDDVDEIVDTMFPDEQVLPEDQTNELAQVAESLRQLVVLLREGAPKDVTEQNDDHTNGNGRKESDRILLK